MRTKFSMALVPLLVCLLSASVMANQPFTIDARAGVLFDYDSGQVLFSQNDNQEWIPASLVKVMTMYVALDRIAAGIISLDDYVTVSDKAWKMGGSQMFLEVGEKVKVEDLLYGISVVSGNDACVAIAEAIAGSEELFVTWMNEKAKSLGLNLHFVDAHGLSDQNRITARDMAILVQHYLNDHPDAIKYHKRLSFAYQPRSEKHPIEQRNRNGLLWSYDGADGLKTGYLSKAGYNLIATAVQENRRLVAVVLGAANERVRENEATRLLNYGFRNFESVEISDLLTDNQQRVFKGKTQTLTYAPTAKVLTIPRGTRDNLEVTATTQRIVAPVEKGQQVGELTVTYNGAKLLSTPLVSTEDVPRGSLFRVLIDTIILFFSQLFQKAR